VQRVLVQAFPESDASCFGLAWALLHLVEAASDGLGDAELGSGPWGDRLRERRRAAGQGSAGLSVEI
jgi:hypothetical protein